ncbi:NADPH-dependent 2,4-dienoyl-CoA reductase/sulfur reductase-like enzyme [Alkalibaculum bacchi]|uniref:NADPH-dependent 2,4-dienoyl-CoA reductase/sulfur reductase-like enzyme n=1 Tax=Alkalibaculum bacchi TaxID=645887 RepID=A0A366I6R5_9FIRM|nr:FAD-dependent oxidoreductase [Alkalibaculum bacchi]RBP64463.1 NADPH-dependent 2,4-dienoyl-CoA reductase/sulfur reductase-like enzyme [Alkalibaculum bacchi]
MNKKVLIVGGVAGGASAAARLRRLDENIEIILFERGQYISFANCGLPYHIGEVIKKREKLLLQTPEAMKKRFNIDVRVHNEVISIDKENKKVSVKNTITGDIYDESYDELILSTGSSPQRPAIPGINGENIFTIWNIPDMDDIKDYLSKENIKEVSIVGGGFIGVEMAENFCELGLDVHIIQRPNQVMPTVDFEMAQFLHQYMEDKGIKLILEDGVKEFRSEGGKTIVITNKGREIVSDLVILSIGIKANSQLAKDAGLELNDRGGIIVNEYLKTSDPHIYAVGDVIQVKDFVNGVNTMVPLAGPANKQGRIVANNIAGYREEYKGTQGTSVAKIFDMTISSTGTNEKTLMKLGKSYGRDYQSIYLHPVNHAGYYPGSQVIHMKLIYELPTGRVLGAQGIGGAGTDKRIDVIATAIRFGATVESLKELELAYAPPYSSAKDPVNMAGFIATNHLSGNMDVIQYYEIEELNLNEYTILDVRTPVERNFGFIPNSINIAVDQLRDRLDELDKAKTIVVYCAVGVRSWTAYNVLKHNGFSPRNLTGGYTTYSTAYYNQEGKIDYPKN